MQTKHAVDSVRLWTHVADVDVGHFPDVLGETLEVGEVGGSLLGDRVEQKDGICQAEVGADLEVVLPEGVTSQRAHPVHVDEHIRCRRVFYDSLKTTS